MTQNITKLLNNRHILMTNGGKFGFLSTPKYLVEQISRASKQPPSGQEECNDCVREPCPRRKRVPRKKPPPCPPKPCPKIRYACELTDPPDHCPYKPPPCPHPCEKKPKKKREKPPSVC